MSYFVLVNTHFHGLLWHLSPWRMPKLSPQKSLKSHHFRILVVKEFYEGKIPNHWTGIPSKDTQWGSQSSKRFLASAIQRWLQNSQKENTTLQLLPQVKISCPSLIYLFLWREKWISNNWLTKDFLEWNSFTFGDCSHNHNSYSFLCFKYLKYLCFKGLFLQSLKNQ